MAKLLHRHVIPRGALAVIAVVSGTVAGFCVGWQLGQYYAVQREFERRYEEERQ